MLELRPNCEACDTDLPADSPDVWICSFECTWCTDCAATFAANTCVNDQGTLVPRPIRTQQMLARFPASAERRHAAGLSVAQAG